MSQNRCWFCNQEGSSMYFSIEFDAYFHMSCLLKALSDTNFHNEEAQIIAEEFQIR